MLVRPRVITCWLLPRRIGKIYRSGRGGGGKGGKGEELKIVSTCLRKLDDWFRLLAQYRAPRCACGDQYQVITKLWLTVSNYKVRYLGDGLITRVITRARASVREGESACSLSWHAINRDPSIANLNLVILVALRNFIDARRAHYFTYGTANETLQSRRRRSLHKDVEESWRVDAKPYEKKKWKISSNRVTMIFSCEENISRILNAFLHLRKTSIEIIAIKLLQLINIIIYWESIYASFFFVQERHIL